MHAHQHWLDAIPREHVLLGGRAVPSYLAIGLAGLCAGVGLQIFLAAINGLSLGLALAVSALGCVGFVVYGLIRRWFAGREVTVLLEHVLLAIGLATLLLTIAGGPVRAQLDVFVAGLCVFLGFGRIGCTLGGCCYGRPSVWGIRYPSGHPAHPHRRFPVQPVAAGVWFALAAAASITACVAPAGAATGAVLVVYAMVRFGLEGLRGDPRPEWAGLSYAQWLATPTILVGLVVAPGGWGGLVAGTGATALAALLWMLRARWLDLRDPLDVSMLDTAARLGAEVAAAEIGEEVHTWEDSGLVVGASTTRGPRGLSAVISLGRPEHTLVDAEAKLLFEAISLGLGLPLGVPERRLDLWAVELLVDDDEPVQRPNTQPALDGYLERGPSPPAQA